MRFFALLAFIASATAISIKKSAGSMDNNTVVYDPFPPVRDDSTPAPPVTEKT